jgi:hypothetical protein
MNSEVALNSTYSSGDCHSAQTQSCQRSKNSEIMDPTNANFSSRLKTFPLLRIQVTHFPPPLLLRFQRTTSTYAEPAHSEYPQSSKRSVFPVPPHNTNPFFFFSFSLTTQGFIQSSTANLFCILAKVLTVSYRSCHRSLNRRLPNISPEVLSRSSSWSFLEYKPVDKFQKQNNRMYNITSTETFKKIKVFLQILVNVYVRSNIIN